MAKLLRNRSVEETLCFFQAIFKPGDKTKATFFSPLNGNRFDTNVSITCRCSKALPPYKSPCQLTDRNRKNAIVKLIDNFLVPNAEILVCSYLNILASFSIFSSLVISLHSSMMSSSSVSFAL